MYEILENMAKSDAEYNEIEDKFKKKFKYYKSNKPKPSLCDVIDVNNNENNQVISFKPSVINNDPRRTLLGLQSQLNWNTFEFKNHPGLIFIKNPFTTAGQRYWIRRCLEEYPKKPNKLNIDNEMNVIDWWAECFTVGKCNRILQKKLRWTTLGYHHDWDTKVYTEDNRTPFPEDLAELTDVVAQYLGYHNFRAEAAIVNYYHMDSTLSAHTDHSEVNLEAPLFSFSFGQAAIFLIGGKDRSIEPSAILLQSGDIVVMSKEARLCYHAVPRIVPGPTPWNVLNNSSMEILSDNIYTNCKYVKNTRNVLCQMKENLNDCNWRKFNEYVKKSRINMNIRQVLNENQLTLT